MNIHEEGKYYAAMVRKFRTEYKSKNLHGFCKDQKVSNTKMLVFDKKKGSYHFSWESFVYLVEGTVLSDRKVAFSDLDSGNEDETRSMLYNLYISNIFSTFVA